MATDVEGEELSLPASASRDSSAREPSPVLKDMNNDSIDEWCQLLQKRKHPFIGLDPDESLYVALDRLLRHKVNGPINQSINQLINKSIKMTA